MPFSRLGLSPSVVTPLARLGYTQPTPVQTAAIPLVLSGTDLLARAQTGTGKTAAFGLPMIDRLLARGQRPRTRSPFGLVLVPTRELAIQVHRSLAAYGASSRLRVTPILGGVGMGPQIQALKQGTDIVVATPGRLIDHLDRRTIDLSAVEILTLDEADRMLDMGFLPPLRRILPALPRTRQTLLFSATMSPEIIRLSAEFTRDPKRVDVSSDQVVAPTVTHRMHPVSVERKLDLLRHVLTQAPVGQALVFCKTKRGSNRVAEYIERAGITVAVIHGNKSQNARNRALGSFKAGQVTTLVATDIAARGLDIVQLPLVVNFDLPLVPEDYVHRVGRTGRAGHAGRAVSLVTSVDRPLLHGIQHLLPAPIENVVLEGFAADRTDATAAHRAPSHGRPRHQRFEPSARAMPNAGPRSSRHRRPVRNAGSGAHGHAGR